MGPAYHFKFSPTLDPLRERDLSGSLGVFDAPDHPCRSGSHRASAGMTGGVWCSVYKSARRISLGHGSASAGGSPGRRGDGHAW